MPEIARFTKDLIRVAETCMILYNYQDQVEMYFRSYFLYHFYSLTLVRIARDLNNLKVKTSETEAYIETFIALMKSMENEFKKFAAHFQNPCLNRPLDDYLQTDYTKMEKVEKIPINHDIKKITNYMTLILTDREKVHINESKAVRDLNNLDHPFPIGK